MHGKIRKILTSIDRGTMRLRKLDPKNPEDIENYFNLHKDTRRKWRNYFVDGMTPENAPTVKGMKK